MRSFWLCSLVLLAVGVLVVSCNTVDPNDCFPNTSGGFGGSGTIPIGAGVGQGSGDFASPRFGPLGYPPGMNPCVDNGSDTPQPGAPSESPAPAATPIVDFKPRDFPFITIIKDDGEGLGGGWQECTTLLTFTNGYDVVYTCRVHIGMPIRTKDCGRLSRGEASNMSAFVCNLAAGKVWPTDLPEGVFCNTFRQQLQPLFDKKYEGCGARQMP